MKIVIFGNGGLAHLTWYFLTNDSPHDVVGFAVDARYIVETEFHGLPVVKFPEVTSSFAPGDCAMLLPIGPIDMNTLRVERLHAARRMGYRIGRYVSTRAMTWPDLEIGDNVMIHDGAIVQPFAHIGENTIVRSGAHVSHHAAIGANCFIASGACLGGNVTVEEGCFIGLNATVRDGVTVARSCAIGAGAVVVADTSPDGLYVGVPARRADRPASELHRL